MKKTLLSGLLLLYLIFISIDVWNTTRTGPGLPNIGLKLMFTVGCVIWIHLGQRDSFDGADFDLIRVFLLFMVVTDFVLAIPAKIEGPMGQSFFAAGIISACFGQCVLILRHLRLSTIDRVKSIGAHRVKISKKRQTLYFAAFVVVEVSILLTSLVMRGIESTPFTTVYVFISVASLTSATLYLLSKNPLRSRLQAFVGVLLLFISDSFIGLGPSILKDPEFVDLIVWTLYAPVLLLIGASILQPRKNASCSPPLAEGGLHDIT